MTLIPARATNAIVQRSTAIYEFKDVAIFSVDFGDGGFGGIESSPETLARCQSPAGTSSLVFNGAMLSIHQLRLDMCNLAHN